jgi:cell division protein FtsL
MMHKQRGLTMISWVIILSLVGIQAVLGMRIVPVYMNYYSVKNIMEEMKNDPSLKGANNEALRIAINKRLNINSIYDLQKDTDAFKFVRAGEKTKIILHYESRGPIYGNLEFVATFDNEIEIPNN